MCVFRIPYGLFLSCHADRIIIIIIASFFSLFFLYFFFFVVFFFSIYLRLYRRSGLRLLPKDKMHHGIDVAGPVLEDLPDLLQQGLDLLFLPVEDRGVQAETVRRHAFVHV